MHPPPATTQVSRTSTQASRASNDSQLDRYVATLDPEELARAMANRAFDQAQSLQQGASHCKPESLRKQLFEDVDRFMRAKRNADQALASHRFEQAIAFYEESRLHATSGLLRMRIQEGKLEARGALNEALKLLGRPMSTERRRRLASWLAAQMHSWIEGCLAGQTQRAGQLDRADRHFQNIVQEHGGWMYRYLQQVCAQGGPNASEEGADIVQAELRKAFKHADVNDDAHLGDVQRMHRQLRLWLEQQVAQHGTLQPLRLTPSTLDEIRRREDTAARCTIV